MNIAELFVRVRGDVSDISPKMRAVQKSLDGVSVSAGGSHASMGRLGQEVVTLTRRMLGLNPVVAQATNVLGGLAIGSGPMIGILAGLAAVGFAFNKLTEESRKTMEAGDKLIETYQKAARVAALGLGGQLKADIEDLGKAAEQHGKWAGFLLSGAAMFRGTGLGAVFKELAGSQSDKITGALSATKEASRELAEVVKKNQEEVARKAKEAADKVAAAWKKQQDEFKAGITSSLAVFDDLASHGTSSSAVNARLLDDYKKLAAQIRDLGDASSPAVVELLKLRDALMANLVVAQAVAAANSTGTVGPLAGKTLPGVSITPSGPLPEPGPMSHIGGAEPIVKVESAIERQTRLEEENAALLSDVISNTASTIGGIVAAAIGIVGNSRGNQIGGALGAAAGTGLGQLVGKNITTAGGVFLGGKLGAVLGSVVPVVGTIVGGLIGSAVGGLFGHHARSVDRNTIALNNLTAQLSNAPGGFRVASYNYNAAEAKRMYRSQVETARRESTRGGRVGFALQAGI